MEDNILKIDLDIPTLTKATKLIKERLAYMNDIKFLNINNVDKIEFLYKSTYGCKITLKSSWTPEFIVILQLLLNSDYKKEINTLINHVKLKMKYSNRLFTSKRYTTGEIKTAKVIDKTKLIKSYVLDVERRINKN